MIFFFRRQQIISICDEGKYLIRIFIIYKFPCEMFFLKSRNQKN